jgi:drug/metabolite transporter (DMT)-like permease
VHIA